LYLRTKLKMITDQDGVLYRRKKSSENMGLKHLGSFFAEHNLAPQLSEQVQISRAHRVDSIAMPLERREAGVPVFLLYRLIDKPLRFFALK
jgi:hypothetical protein